MTRWTVVGAARAADRVDGFVDLDTALSGLEKIITPQLGAAEKQVGTERRIGDALVESSRHFSSESRILPDRARFF